MASAAAGAARPEEYGPRPGVLFPQPATNRGFATVLSCSADGQYLIYANGTNVVIRSIKNPELGMVYSEHTSNVKAAKFSPSGKYVASCDESGKVRVWAFTHPDHTLKYELPSIGGEAEDVVWDSESTRIAVVGGGSAKAKVFSWDTGSNLAEIIPHSKKVITVDFRPARPYRLAFGGEDFNCSFYTGPPFRYNKGLKEHSNFVNCLRFSPDGSRFASVSSDKTGVIYEAEDGTVIGKLDPTQAHSGSIYGCAWSADSTRLVTCGGDKSIKLWDMTGSSAGGSASGAGAAAGGGVFRCIATFTVGTRAEDMQNAVVWPTPETIISLSLDGTLNYFDAADITTGPVRRVYGHVATVTAMSYDDRSGEFVSGDASGRVMRWTPTDAIRTIYIANPVTGDVPTKKIAAVLNLGEQLTVASWDDKQRIGSAVTGELKPGTAVALPGQPKGVASPAAHPNIRVTVTGSAVVVFNDGAIASNTPAAYGPTCVDVSADGSIVVVGGNDKKLHFYTLNAGTGALAAAGDSNEFHGALSVVTIAPDGRTVAAGDQHREVRLYSTGADHAALRTGRWTSHTTRVTGLKFSPNGRHIASVSIDRRLCVWSPASDAPVLSIDLANPVPFAGVVWADDTTIWTMGTDGVLVRRVLTLQIDWIY